MPMRSETPIVTETINAWNVTALEVQMRWNDLPFMVVALASGYDDGNGVVWLRDTRFEIPPGTLIESWSSVPDQQTIFAAVRTGIYSYLQAIGAIPPEATWADQ